MAGTPGDFATAKDFLALVQAHFGAVAPAADGGEPIYPAGSAASRNATLSIPHTSAPTAWIDVYYPVMNTPLNHSVEILDEETGEKVGELHLGGALSPSGPVIVDDVLVAGSQDGNVYLTPLSDIVDEETGGSPLLVGLAIGLDSDFDGDVDYNDQMASGSKIQATLQCLTPDALGDYAPYTVVRDDSIAVQGPDGDPGDLP